MDIRVGDLVTYKNLDGDIITTLIYDSGDLKRMEKALKSTELIKIERPKYEVVEEKKELLTEEEKEFLRQCKKLNNSINNIQSFENTTYLMDEDRDKNVFTLKDIHKNLFKKLKDGHVYTLKELGLEEK